MARSFWQGMITWFAGCAAGFIIWSLIFKIGWENKEHILVLGYGAMATFGGFLYKFSMQIKKAELKDIHDKIDRKADVTELTILHVKLDAVIDSQEETHALMQNVYDHLLNSNPNSIIIKRK